MRPDTLPDACWTSFIGAPTHSLGDLPEKCLTCAAKRAEDEAASRHRLELVLDNLRRQELAADRAQMPECVTCQHCGKDVVDWRKTGHPSAMESHLRTCMYADRTRDSAAKRCVTCGDPFQSPENTARKHCWRHDGAPVERVHAERDSAAKVGQD